MGDPTQGVAVPGSATTVPAGVSQPEANGTPAPLPTNAHDLVIEYLTQPVLPAIPTGFDDIDHWMHGGFHRQAIYVLAGRTREGKSALALSMARRMALDHHARVLYVSLEMSKMELIERMICQATLKSITELGDLKTNKLLVPTLAPMMTVLKEAWLNIEDESAGTIDDLDVMMERIKPHTPDVLVIDHLQHTRQDGAMSRSDSLNNYMVELKAFAKRHHVAILLCCQINREGNEKPSLIHLKGSGAIEEVADVVMIGNRINYESSKQPDDTKKETEYEVWVAKQRRGPEYKFNLLFRPWCFEFVNPPKYGEPSRDPNECFVVPDD